MVVKVKNLVVGCDTNDQGAAVYSVVADKLRKDAAIVLDFSGITNVTSSFVNSSFVQLADDFGVDVVKSCVTLRGVNGQIGRMLQDRLMKVAA